ncbi:hypothetical protein T265_07426 [Opisthorchis viverrini]|uniref:Uncharacterized protein n=1 Tax=Opisthorchis viverrini TaxID=6198 RepID=A0A074ZNX7_OPIVI|nr:hypothetical protein T265_07426 [Opisthorchis viverrini]KER25030.1 hypothetical protein T265_07426 [Opisthorchis viverrini]
MSCSVSNQAQWGSRDPHPGSVSNQAQWGSRDPHPGRHFDAPYENALDGFFGKVEPPASFVSSRSLRLRLEHVEPGEEAKELEESSSCEGSQTIEVQSQCTQHPDDITPTGSAVWSTGNELDRWELIANEPNQRDSS